MRKTRKEIRYKKYMIGIIMILLTLVNFIIIPNKTSAAVQTYSIVYNANGGTGTPATQIKAKDKTITLSSKIPQRTGYKFLGWATTSTAKTAKYKPGSKYSANSGLRLFAVWQANTYKISYNANGGSGAPAAQTKTYGKSLILSTLKPTKKGYIFQGWAVSKSASSPQYKAGGTFRDNKDTILYAVWKIKTYTIKYDANKGVNAPATQTKKYGQAITLSKNKPKRANHTFIGWAKSQTSQLPSYKAGDKYSANESIVLYAYWMQDTFKITYHANGGSGGVSSQIKKRQGDLKLSKNIPRRSGYTFLGWGLSKDATTISYYPGDMYTQNAEKELYAIWGKTMRTTYRDSFALPVLGSGVCVLNSYCVYEEDYKKNSTRTSFYNHRIYLKLDESMLNDKENLVVYSPYAIMHTDSTKKRTKTFVLNHPEESLERADYVFYYSNRDKASYNNENEVVGSSSFFFRYGGIPTLPKNEIKMNLCGSLKNKNAGMTKQAVNYGDNYYYSLGEIEGEYIQEKQTEQLAVDYSLKGAFKDTLSAPEVVAIGKESAVNKEEIECYIKERELTGIVTNEDRKEIINQVLVQKELTKEALNAGCEKTASEALAYIEELRKKLKLTSNYNEYLEFISGTGMTEDEYWESKVEEYKMQLTRKEYIDKLYEEYKKGRIVSISNYYKKLNTIILQKGRGQLLKKHEFKKALRESIVEINDIDIMD